MEPIKFTDFFQNFLEQTIEINKKLDGAGILILLEGTIDWNRLKKITEGTYVAIAATKPEYLEGAQDFDFKTVLLNLSDASSVYDRMTGAILEAVADDLFMPGSRIIAIYSGFDNSMLDSISIINLGEHLERLSGKELRKIETKVPLKTLKMVVDLALEIGREGREGKAVGTLFVVGDTKNVLRESKPAGFDPVRGYKCKERCLFDPRVREGIKEIAQLDGAFIISLDATVIAACRLLDTSTAMITLSKGLGSRHWAAAAISRTTNAIAIVVSQSSGTVRIFVNGEVVLRIESRHRRPMVWKDFEYEQPIQN
ncbi:MAG: DNA integrity scanning protein DisA nucleotide-binding domain protein [Planctomycetia bacterium]|nr:DNA integrity scanning protein DisA nucleotide-binding domain protein [Planctomycetia bacterium]